MSDEKQELLKLVIIGESGVGKTSIITQFIEEVFISDKQSTIGGTFSSKSVQCGNGKILKLEIWDTAGQERYRSVTKMFYKDANAAILVYDITNKNSFNQLQNYWAEQVKESSPKNIIIAIAANKCDLFEKEVVDEKEARDYAKSIGAIFSLTSAKSTAGINDLFIEISKKYSGSDSATVIEKNEEIQEFKKIRKESVLLTKNSQKNKKKGFC
jgi:small GTP-binding protein